jgi:hypothetical protein
MDDVSDHVQHLLVVLKDLYHPLALTAWKGMVDRPVVYWFAVLIGTTKVQR